MPGGERGGGFIRGAGGGPPYPAVAEAMEGKAHKKLCENTTSFDPAFRAWRVDPGPQYLIRVTHSSGMLEGKYTIDTKFDETDHRSHRPRAWLVEGLQKVARLEDPPRHRGVTIGQLPLLWLYAHPSIISALPSISKEQQLLELAHASDHAPLPHH